MPTHKQHNIIRTSLHFRINVIHVALRSAYKKRHSTVSILFSSCTAGCGNLFHLDGRIAKASDERLLTVTSDAKLTFNCILFLPKICLFNCFCLTFFKSTRLKREKAFIFSSPFEMKYSGDVFEAIQSTRYRTFYQSLTDSSANTAVLVLNITNLSFI